jgi:signal transduction histidine kinase
MINTVLRNLTTNAIKFTPDGGEIRVESEKGSKFYFTLPKSNG